MKNSPISQRGKIGFPYETYVEASVTGWLFSQGFEIIKNRPIDVFATKADGDLLEVWHIECKGLTSQNTVDFCTGIGQLLKRMSSQETRYAIALPDLPVFRKQVAQFAPWVCSALNLHWLWIDDSGAVRVDYPQLQESQVPTRCGLGPTST